MNFNVYTLPKKFFSSDNALSYDLVVKYTTFGKDSSWKRHIAKNVKEEHIRILDLACGTGIYSTFIPSSNLEMFGADMTYDYIIKAKNRMRYSFLTNCVAEFLPFQSDTFDVVLSSYLAKYANIPLLVDELWRIIKKNGSIIFHDFTYPTNFFMQTMWKSYFVILNLIGKIAKPWELVFSDLDDVIEKSEWVKDLVETLDKKGFKSVTYKYYTCGTAAIVSAIKS